MKLSTLLAAASLAASVTAFAQPPDGRPPRRPPEEAFTACANQNEGDACTVTFGEHTVEGKCRKVPEHIKEDAGKLVCMPPHPPHPPRAPN